MVVTSGGNQVSNLAGNIVLPNTPIAQNVLSANLQRRLAHVNEKFGSSIVSSDQNEDEDVDDEDEDSDSQDGQVMKIPSFVKISKFGMLTFTVNFQMCVMSGSDMVNRYPKRRYIINGKQELDDNNAKNVTQIITYMPDILEHNETSKLESSFVEVKVRISPQKIWI